MSFAKAILLSFLLPAAWTTHAGAATVDAATCGNGILDSGEECDPGSLKGSPDCNLLCKRIQFEPAVLQGSHARIAATDLFCKPFEVRQGDRNLAPVHVRYRIHLCRNSKGDDSFTPEQIRTVMAEAAAEYALAGIILEEESLVRFTEKDCDLPLGESGWSDALVANTPEGVLALSFVTAISDPVNSFSIGGFCDFFGPFCVNAGVFDTLVIHELGHFFGLAHTFECAFGRETAESCADSGDQICDTPPDRGPKGVRGIAMCDDDKMLDGSCTGTCGKKVCADGSKPDGYNWMSYFDCTPGRFSNEQLDFMRCTLSHEMRAYNADASTETTTTSTTSTTIPVDTVCGDMNGDGDLTATDALSILRAGVGLSVCENWQCDYNGSGLVSTADALAVLKTAVGGRVGGKCPPKP